MVLPRRQREDQPQLPVKADEGHFPKVDNALIGLALSGGGVGAAIYSLGAVQRLSQLGVLPYVDYLSIASGGGYLGASWSSLAAGDSPYGSSKERFPFKFIDDDTNADRQSTTVSRTLYVTSEPTATGWRRTWACLMFGHG
ncbi:MAG: patatin-like phospholipase family protein [Chloroflexi bacterium]|nr:patatin-like phospholipase family protein [Chloroflexota bacterium]